MRVVVALILGVMVGFPGLEARAQVDPAAGMEGVGCVGPMMPAPNCVVGTCGHAQEVPCFRDRLCEGINHYRASVHCVNGLGPHYPYDVPGKGYYFFRPYNYTMIPQQQAEIVALGGDPRQPYDNRFFRGIYRQIEAEEAVGAPPALPALPVAAAAAWSLRRRSRRSIRRAEPGSVSTRTGLRIDRMTSDGERHESEGPPLRPILGPRFALGREHVAICAVFGLMLIYLNVLGLWYTDLWGHVAYGRWILIHRALPTFEPFMPLAARERVINYCWLAQVIFALAERLGGAEALSNLFAVTVLARYLIAARVCYLQTRRLGLAMAGMGAMFAMGWVRNPVLRPEVFAALCFQALLWVLVALDSGARQWPRGVAVREAHWSWWVWVFVPVLFAAWVNLHSTVAIGLAVLGAHAAGRAVELVWESRRVSLRRLIRDPWLLRWTALTIIAGLAILVNPRGPWVVADSFRISGNPNLRTVTEWLPLSSTGLGGRIFAASWGLLVLVMRFSRRTVRPVEVILLAAFSIGVLQSGRIIAWYVPVYVYAVLPHVAEIVGRLWPARLAAPIVPADRDALPPHRSFRYTLVCIGVVWASFALSHLSDRLLGADPRSPESLYHPSTPRGLADFLNEHPPRGLVWNSQALGDWLTWASIKHGGGDVPALQLFTNTHMHIIPRQVWADYQAIGLLRPNWRELLDKYKVNTLVISKVQHPILSRDIRTIPGWTIVFEDENGLIATRAAQPAGRRVDPD